VVRSSRHCTQATPRSIKECRCGDLHAWAIQPDFRCALIPQFTRRDAFDRSALDQRKQAGSSRPAPKFWAALSFSRCSKTVCSQGGFPLGRILDLHKPELSVSGLSSGRQQTLAPLGPYSQRVSGMQSRMVWPLPLLSSNSSGRLAEQSPLLFTLQETAAARGARRIDCFAGIFSVRKRHG
jgi:hypothetical protein